MRLIIKILLILDILGLCIGFYLKSDRLVLGEFIIGVSLVIGFFIVMPLFIYYRWKNKNVKDYMLTKESIIKMREYNDSKDRKN